jgi:hypothetical protein
MSSKHVLHDERTVLCDSEAHTFGPLAAVFDFDFLFGEPAEV